MTKTYEEISQEVTDYIESCGKDSILDLWTTINQKELVMDDNNSDLFEVREMETN